MSAYICMKLSQLYYSSLFWTKFDRAVCHIIGNLNIFVSSIEIIKIEHSYDKSVYVYRGGYNAQLCGGHEGSSLKTFSCHWIVQTQNMYCISEYWAAELDTGWPPRRYYCVVSDICGVRDMGEVMWNDHKTYLRAPFVPRDLYIYTVPPVYIIHGNTSHWPHIKLMCLDKIFILLSHYFALRISHIPSENEEISNELKIC